MRPLNHWKLPLACAVAITSLPLALVVLARRADSAPTVKPAAPAAAVAAAAGAAKADPTMNGAVEVSLNDALGRRWVRDEYLGNGCSEVQAGFVNQHGKPLRLTVPSGTIFETADLRHQMVAVRGQTIELPAGSTRAARLVCAATRSTNALKPQPYRLCPDTLQCLNDLFVQVDKTPEASREAIQAAVLMLTENAPLDLFARFSLLAADPNARPAGPAVYRTSTAEILGAFALLRDAGYPRMNLMAAQEPQLKIEAMIDPLAHAAAVKYYHLNTEQEWTYWRDELQRGDASTRHYALYGIGRYYPDVALQMLPDWARANHLNPLMRTSAIQALAETHKPEAISVLQELVSEFGGATELGQSARKAIAYLENQRAVPVAASPVEFRLSQADVR